MKKKIIGILVIMLMITAATLPALGDVAPKESNTPLKQMKQTISGFIFRLFERFPNMFTFLKYFIVVSGFMDGLVKEGTGKLVLKLTDAPPELNITEALVTISEVRVHYEGFNGTNGSWITVVNESQTFDLIQLENATEFLGDVTLDAGWYTQIRLYVESALVTIDGEKYDLEIPSKNVKLITPWLVQDNETLTLILDFDVHESVHKTGSDKYIMRPTIKVFQEGGGGFECDAGGDYEAEVNETIQFTGTAWGGVEPYTWSWDFGDGETSTDQNPTHAYTEEGEYEIILTVTDAENNTATDDTEAEIGEEEEEEFECDAGGDYEAEVNETIQFTGTAWGGVEPYTWSWDFGDGETSTDQNPTHAYTEEGEYEIILTVTDAENNTSTDDAEAEIWED